MSSTHTQKIGLTTATIVGMNAMIGAGIFAVPAALASSVGPAGIITYAFVIVAVWFMALSLARLSQLFPQEGSFYIYTKQLGGHIFGLISAGSYLIGLTIAMGLLCQVAGNYFYGVFPFLSATTWGALTLLALVLLNMRGVSLSQAGQMVLILCTVAPLIITIIMCFSHANISNLTPFMPFGFANILLATKAVIFGFFGFESAASLFAIIESPQKNLSRAITYSIVLVGILYMLFVTSLLLAIPISLFADPTMRLTDILRQVFPTHSWLIGSIHFAILSAVIGTIHSMIWGSSALLISFLKQFKNKTVRSLLHTGTFNHATSVLVIGSGIFATFMLLNNIDLFFSLTALFLIFAFATSMITLLTIKDEWRSKRNVITVIGLLTALLIFMFAMEGLVQEIIKL